MGDTNLSLLSTGELLDSLAGLERESRVRTEKMLRLIGEMDRRGVAAELGHKDLPQVFKHHLQWDIPAGKAKVRHARLLTPQLSPSGAEVRPELPATAAALAEGAVTEQHVEAIAAAMKDVPDEVPARKVAAFEQALVEYARAFEPRSTRKFGTEQVYRHFQNDKEPVDKDPAPPINKLILRREKNRLKVHGDFDWEPGAKLEALIDPLAKPHPTGPEGPDPRSLIERQGDAFAELINLLLRADVMPEHGGETVTLAMTLSFDDLAKQVGAAMLDNQQRISARQVRKLACEAGIIPIVLGGRSEPLNIGRKTRALNSGLRRALVARDGGCAFPGCDRPPKHCEGHHVRHWADGGETSLRNCVLLCRRHHDLIHHSDWEVKIRHGIPYFYPPSFVDPLRQPRRNPLHKVS